MHNSLTASENTEFAQLLDSQTLQDITQFDLFAKVIESFIGGLIILNQQATKVIYANSHANKICQNLTQKINAYDPIPKQIFEPCQEAAKNHFFSSNKPKVFEVETSGENTYLRIRVQSLSLDDTNQFYLLVIIEDRQDLVKFDAHKYHLTPSEEKVWLLRTAKYTKRQIAEKLTVSINTIKKHMKNINAKREDVINLGS